MGVHYILDHVAGCFLLDEERGIIETCGENEKEAFLQKHKLAQVLSYPAHKDELRKSLELSKLILEKIKENDWELKVIEKGLLDAAGEKRGDLLWPLRVALTGAQKSPSPFEVCWVLGKTETLKRISSAIEVI